MKFFILRLARRPVMFIFGLIYCYCEVPTRLRLRENDLNEHSG
jgi:hypothetical protein